MFKPIKRVFQYFKRRPQNVTVHQRQFDDALHGHFDAVGEFIPIETNIDDQPVSGTVTQSVSKEERLLQTQGGQLITLSRRKGIRCGCGHFIYSIDPDGRRAYLGGQCPYCALETAQLLKSGTINLEQAEAMSLYCDRCSSTCQGCGTSLCRRHLRQFALDGTLTYSFLCPDCLRQAEQDKFFKQALTIMFSPFLDYKRLPPLSERKPYDY